MIRRLLTSRHITIIAAAAGVVLVLPSLGSGRIGDDFVHGIMLRGSRHFGEVLEPGADIFRFFNGDARRTRKLIDRGIVPWWTVEHVNGAFWRPLAAQTHQLDYAFWPDSPALMHAQSIFWYGLAVFAAALLYRRLMGAVPAAGLAALLYAIDHSHGMPVGFLANRNSIIATFFGVLALLAHDTWRRGGKKYFSVVAPAMLGLSLLSAEAGIAACAYLVAYALFIDSGGLVRRGVRLIPYAAVVIAWRVAWSAQGYGVSNGLGLYIDPLHDPLGFAVALVQRAPLLLLGQWALPPADIGVMLSPAMESVAAVAAVAALAVLAIAIWPAINGAGVGGEGGVTDTGRGFGANRVARFFALGMLLSVIPSCATFTSNRLLFFVGLGAMGLCAQFICVVFGWWRGADLRPPQPAPGRAATNSERRTATTSMNALVPIRITRFRHATAWTLFAIHAIASPLALPFYCGLRIRSDRLIDRIVVRARMDPFVEQQDVMIVNAPVPLFADLYPLQCDLEGRPVPRRLRCLASGLPSVRIERRDEHTLIIRPETGYLSWMFDQLFRSDAYPLRLGDQFELTGLTITITEMSSGTNGQSDSPSCWRWASGLVQTQTARPAAAEFRFDVPLEHPSLRWLQWEGGQFVPFTLPGIGETVELRPGWPWERGDPDKPNP